MSATIELILKKDLETLGRVGDVVKVSRGYARNFLLPRGIATSVNAESLQFIAFEKVAE